MGHNDFVTTETKQKPGTRKGMGKGINDLCFSELFLEAFSSSWRNSPCCLSKEAVSSLNSNWQLSYDHTWQADYETAEGGLVPARSVQSITRGNLYLWRGWTNLMDKQICLELSAFRQFWNQIMDWINWTGLGTLGWETPHWGLLSCTAWLIYVLLGVS